MKKMTALLLALLLSFLFYACGQNATSVTETGEQATVPVAETGGQTVAGEASDTEGPNVNTFVIKVPDADENEAASTLPPEIIAEHEDGMFKYTEYSDGTASILRYKGNSTSVTVPDKLGGLIVTEIGSDAFIYCAALTEVVLPNGLTTIGDTAFLCCTSLTAVKIPDSVTSIGCGAFSTTPWLAAQPQTDGWIELGAGIRFVYAGDNVSVSVPAGKERFDFCWNQTVQEVTVPANVTEIDSSAFAYCSALRKIVLPERLVSIGESSFIGCSVLNDVTIPDSVTEIGNEAFYQCALLTEIVLPERLSCINDYTFACCGLKSVAIPDKVTEIKDNAFAGCYLLTDITFSQGKLATIGSGAFEDCTALTLIVLPEGLITVGRSAFGYCYALAEVVLPEGITIVDDSTFFFCEALSVVTIPGSVIEIGNDAFHGCEEVTVICPEGSYAWQWAKDNGVPCKAT